MFQNNGDNSKLNFPFQGHHGDAGAAIADCILPGAAYTEKQVLPLHSHPSATPKQNIGKCYDFTSQKAKIFNFFDIFETGIQGY